MSTPETARSIGVCSCAIVASTLCFFEDTFAGAFIFSGESNGTGLITHPIGYTGTGGTIDLNVCIVPGSPLASNMEQSVRNNVAIWNKTQSTTSNLRNFLPSSQPDFESVALHELGHCIGLAHPNQASESGLQGADQNYTKSTNGADNVFNINAGTDGVIGSGDDTRGDDVNLHWFYTGTNNPFAEQAVVDSSTYTQALAGLPLGDNYTANADRTVSALPRYNAPNTEASMQQGSFGGELQRTLGHDDVSTLRFAMSGLDEIQGTTDDYDISLTYKGISSTDCDINISMDATQTGFAVCGTSGAFINNGPHVRITSADIFFNPNFNWFFNNNPPCNESIAMVEAVWKMVSLPCQVGVSTSAAVVDVFGDDLGTTNYNVDWVVFEFEYTDQGNGLMGPAYKMLSLTDELDSTKGYWIITNESGKTIDVQGEYHSEINSALYTDSAAGEPDGWNMAGMPFRFPVVWADSRVVAPTGEILTLAQSDPAVGTVGSASGTACTDGPMPTTDCKVAQFAYKYDQATMQYELLGPNSGSVEKWDAVWVYAADTEYALRFPMPPAELVTP